MTVQYTTNWLLNRCAGRLPQGNRILILWLSSFPLAP